MARLPYGERKLRNEMFTKGLLWCAYCNQFLPVKKFGKNKRSDGRTNYGYRFYCKKCESVWKKAKSDHYRSYYKDKNRDLKEQAVELAGGCCQKCGYDKYLAGFDFHHIYRVEKSTNPAMILYSKGIEVAWKELDKCCLLCRNCHSGYEANEWRAKFVKRDGLGWTVGRELPLDDKRYEIEIPKYEQALLPDTYLTKPDLQLSLFEVSRNGNTS
jgi:hypothetical protein